VSEQILNSTSAQLGWEIQDRRQIKNTDDTETKHNTKKANNTKHSKTKLPVQVQSPPTTLMHQK